MIDRPAGVPDNLGRGIGFALVALLIFSTQDAAGKFLVQTVSPFQTTMMRFWAFAAFAVVLAVSRGSLRTAFRTRFPILQILRGILLVVDIWMFVASLKTVQLPEVQSITLIYPLVVTLAAIPLLGERVGLFRITAVAVGFLGALFIVRAGGVPLDWGVLFAVGSGVAYALYIILTRRVSESDSATTSMLYVGTVGLVLSSAVGMFFWQPLDLPEALGVGYIMITGVVAHGLMILALGMAPASVLQPFNYTSLPWSIVLSYFIFGHLIDLPTVIGAAVIVGAGLVVMARERFRRVPAVAGPTLPGKE
jgi:drug/metabolite transporter (DMT)-like permease